MRVLADGADGLSNLVSAAAEKTTRRILDWFHISMRLRPIEQMSSGIAVAAGRSDSILNELLQQKLPRMRYQMWHGKWQAAFDRMEKIYRATGRLLDTLPATDHSNWSALTNYAAERRKGMRISSALAESVMSHLVNQRMGKRQPMRWSCEGVHLLLQVRSAVLDQRLDCLFREWHPKFRKQLALPLPAQCDRPNFDTVPKCERTTISVLGCIDRHTVSTHCPSLTSRFRSASPDFQTDHSQPTEVGMEISFAEITPRARCRFCVCRIWSRFRGRGSDTELGQAGKMTFFQLNYSRSNRHPKYRPRRRNLWVTDTLQWAPEARLAQPANPMWDSAASAFSCS